MSNTAQIFVITVVLLSLLSYLFLLWTTSKMKTGEDEAEEMKHEFDGIKEFNTPMPKWWFWTFLAAIVWAIGFVFYYPALGNFKGFGNWTGVKQYNEEIQATNKKYNEYYASMTKGSIEEISTKPQVVKTGRRLFLNNCAVCHGSDAHGALGFPNLTDNDWLYGGKGKTIEKTITDGRHGNMPSQRQAVIDYAKANKLNTGTIIDDTVNYILSLSGHGKANPAGKQVFANICAACHTPAGTGMAALGSANLTDNIWLYDTGERSKESLVNTIITSINHGRSGLMPAHKEILGNEKIKLLAAYVYSLSHPRD
ncbi:MAG: cytochrome-c oxidase, cbb3-type subunit III [Ostreibacterium sp.]